MNSYLVFLLFIFAAVGLVAVIVLLNLLLGPKTVITDVKLEPFECGSRPLQTRNVRPLSIKYYPIAIFFLLFDLETVLLFLWASSTGEAGISNAALGTFLFFMGLLTIAFVYIWKEGGLEWR